MRVLPGGAHGGSVQFALRIAATTALSEIQAALVRIAKVEYGQCVSCAQPIPAGRTRFAPGDEVIAMLGADFGGHAEYAVVRAGRRRRPEARGT